MAHYELFGFTNLKLKASAMLEYSNQGLNRFIHIPDAHPVGASEASSIKNQNTYTRVIQFVSSPTAQIPIQSGNILSNTSTMESFVSGLKISSGFGVTANHAITNKTLC